MDRWSHVCQLTSLRLVFVKIVSETVFYPVLYPVMIVVVIKNGYLILDYLNVDCRHVK